MALSCQHRLTRTLQHSTLSLDVRIIVTARRDRSYYVMTGEILSDMYYALGSLTLELPPA